MTLFAIERYMGEEEEEKTSSSTAQTLLEHINQRAAQREKELKKVRNAEKTDTVQGANKPAEPAATHKDKVVDRAHSVKKKHKHKGESQELTISDGDKVTDSLDSGRTINDNSEAVEGFHSVKKKHKHKAAPKELAADDSELVDSFDYENKRKEKDKIKASKKEGEVSVTCDKAEADGIRRKKKSKKKHVSCDSNAGSCKSENDADLDENVSVSISRSETEPLVKSDKLEVDLSSSQRKSKDKKHKRDKKGTTCKTEQDINVDIRESEVMLGDLSVGDIDNEDNHLDVTQENSDGSSDGEEERTMEGEETLEEETKEIEENTEPVFQVLGEHKHRSLPKVQRVLPPWLAHPTVITNDLSSEVCPVSEMTCLDADLKLRLADNGVTHMFPVQRAVIPSLLSGHYHGSLAGPALAGYIPNDICCSAPTGSGKTLAFVLPVVQALKSRIVCRVRALVVLPVRDLAAQVYKVFCAYTQGTPLKVALVVGEKPLAKEQQQLVKKGVRGVASLVDIIVATPGRLVDHIQHTPGFSLEHLRYLVIDEADRMMDEIKQDWLRKLESSLGRSYPAPPLTAATAHCTDRLPLQKLLFSATLSQNPEKLQQLHLVQPRLITAVPQTDEGAAEVGCVGPPEGGAAGEARPVVRAGSKFTTPEGLTEYLVQVTAHQKPLVLLHLLMTLKYRRVLCFTNSRDTTHRLYLLIKKASGLVVREISAQLSRSRRAQQLQKFAVGKIDVLVATDAMTRGMDVRGVRCVVTYDVPRFAKTYVHRVGRTARAGRAGTSIALLLKKEIFHFKKMIAECGKDKVKELKFTRGDLRPLEARYRQALKELGEALEKEKVEKQRVG